MKPNWIIKRALIFIGVYFLFLILSEVGGLKSIVQKYVKNVVNSTLTSIGNGGEVDFLDIKTKKDKTKYKGYDILVSMSSKQQKENAIDKARAEGKARTTYNPVKFGINSWVHFGMIFSFFMALIFAIPTSWKNRLLLFFVGFLFLNIFLVFKMWLSLNLKYAVRYEKFEVGWTNDFLIQAMNHINNIVSFPFFGFLMMTIISISFSYKKVVEVVSSPALVESQS